MSEPILLAPTLSNVRHQDPDNVYHIYNRVAHSVRFLDNEEKDDLLDRVRRIAEFCGIRLLSWCMMTNHFHLLVYLPVPKELSREELRRRFDLLKDDERAVFIEGFIKDRAPMDVVSRMCNIGMMMKMIKENFTIAYNERTGHHGTMWEGPYRYKKIPMRTHDMSTVAAYQNLNPIRACMVADFESYPWTAFAAAKRGDIRALEGIDFIFGGYEERTNVSNTLVHSAEELVGLMEEKMNDELDKYELEKAEAVWRRRFAGKAEEREDPLTVEAKMAQVEARMNKLQADELHRELAKVLGREAKEDEIRMIRAIAVDPAIKSPELAKIVGSSESRIKRLSLLLQKCGVIRREGTKRRSAWIVSLFRQESAA